MRGEVRRRERAGDEEFRIGVGRVQDLRGVEESTGDCSGVEREVSVRE